MKNKYFVFCVFLFLKDKHFYAVAVKCLFRVTFLAVSWHVLLYRERVFKEGEKLETPTQTGTDDREIQVLPSRGPDAGAVATVTGCESSCAALRWRVSWFFFSLYLYPWAVAIPGPRAIHDSI